MCIQGSLVIHVPAIKDQHKAISQSNRFVSSASRALVVRTRGHVGPGTGSDRKREAENKV